MTDSSQRRPLTRAALARLAAALAPGSRVLAVRRLGGGLDAAMHRVTLATPAGARLHLVVRRYPSYQPEAARALVGALWRTLGLLAALGVAAPRPLHLDADGLLFGEPALVMSRAPGRAWLTPSDPARWIGQLAAQLAALHRTPLDGHDRSFLDGPEAELDEQLGWLERHTAGLRGVPEVAALRAALLTWRPRLPAVAPALVHNDFWSGNVLWRRGAPSALVDWDDPAFSYPGLDVGSGRLDVALLYGREAADAFYRAYRAAGGPPVPHLFFWDLLAAQRALPRPAEWAPPYRELGLTTMTDERLVERYRAFLADALERAAAAAAGARRSE